ncbi:MAG: hydroxyacylglutathione hydrolase, partial [Pseudomonadota bacterium]
STAAASGASIDAVENALNETGWKLTHILVTHHHWDHTQGIAELKGKTDCHVIGPEAEKDKISTLDETMSDGDQFEFSGHEVQVLSTPGHTLGMINFYFPASEVVFSGDTLFVLGCGRIFEGNPEMMWDSLNKLAVLPENTTVYCSHEYTQSNAKFALTVDPDNAELQSLAEEIDALRAAGKSTVPTTIGRELKTNPFLRAADPAIRSVLEMENASDADVFAEIRSRKDNA